MKKLLLFFLALFASVSSSAYDFEVGGIYYNVISEEDHTCEAAGRVPGYTDRVVGLSSVTFDGTTYSVTRVGSSAFSGWSSLEWVILGNSVTEIGAWAFKDCTKLSYVEIGNSVTTIGSSAFQGCSKLTTIVSMNVTPPIVYDSSTFEGVKKWSCVVKVPSKAVNAYKAADYWKEFEIVPIDGEEDVATDVLALDGTKTVRVRADRGRIVVSDTTQGEKVELYTADGTMLASVTTVEGETTVPCFLRHGSTYILKCGNRAIKYSF